MAPASAATGSPSDEDILAVCCGGTVVCNGLGGQDLAPQKWLCGVAADAGFVIAAADGRLCGEVAASDDRLVIAAAAGMFVLAAADGRPLWLLVL